MKVSLFFKKEGNCDFFKYQNKWAFIFSLIQLFASGEEKIAEHIFGNFYPGRINTEICFTFSLWRAMGRVNVNSVSIILLGIVSQTLHY